MVGVLSVDVVPGAILRMNDVAPVHLAVWLIRVAILIVGVLATTHPYR